MSRVRGQAQRPSIFLARFTSAFSSSTMPWLRRCFLRLPVVGAEANAAPDFRPAWRRRILPEPVTLNRLLAPEWVLFLGMCLSPLYGAWSPWSVCCGDLDPLPRL